MDAQTRQILQEHLLAIWSETTAAAERRTLLLKRGRDLGEVTHAVDEAVFTADRVAVMSSRPGIIREIAPVYLGRPGTDAVRGAAELAEVVKRIWTSSKRDALRASGDG